MACGWVGLYQRLELCDLHRMSEIELANFKNRLLHLSTCLTGYHKPQVRIKLVLVLPMILSQPGLAALFADLSKMHWQQMAGVSP